LKSLKIIQFLVLVLAAVSSPAQAIVKCTDSNGKVLYQDKPCEKSHKFDSVPIKKKQFVSNSQADIKIVDIKAGSTQYSIGFPDTWKAEVRSKSSNPAPTLRVVAPGQNRLILLMTFLPKGKSFGMDEILFNELMQEIHDRHSKSKSERKVESRPINLIFSTGLGHLLTYVDDSLKPIKNLAKDEFAYVSTGVLVIDGKVITLTILSNDPGTSNYSKAVAAIHTIVKKDS
jgi:hypothetical protein